MSTEELQKELLLRSMSVKDLEREMRRRMEEEASEKEKEVKRQHVTKLKTQAPCPIVGRAYNSEYSLQNTTLLKFTIKGNASSDYNIVLPVSSGVATYFGNTFPTFERWGLENTLAQLARQWVVKQLQDPAVIADLMDLSNSHRFGEEAYVLTVKQGIEELCSRFTLEQLEAAVEKHPSHGLNLLKLTIPVKKGVQTASEASGYSKYE